MLKKLAFKKILIISLSFIILLLIYLFPKDNTYNIKTTLTYSNPPTTSIYLIDHNNLVSRFEVIKNTNNINELIKEIINNLTIDNNSNNHIPTNFQKVIPKNTVLINFDLNNNGLLKLNFSKEFFNVTQDNEEKMLEAIIYSLTELKEIKKIMIFIEGKNLIKLPHSNKYLPNTLDRSYGINKIYELESMKNINKVTTYYISKIDNLIYYVPVTTYTNKDKEKIEIIIEQLKSMPTYQTNLVSYLSNSTKLLKYEILENSVNLSFNNEILNLSTNAIVEEVKYSIALSIRDTYNINETIFYIDDLLIDAFFI